MTLFEKGVYIRFADEPTAFVYTVKYSGCTVRSERVMASSSRPRSAAAGGACDDASVSAKVLRKRISDSGHRAG